MSKGYNQSDIAKELHTTRRTVLRDVAELNQWTKKGLYDLAKQSLSTMLYSCIIGLNEIEKEAWKIYRSNDNDKVYALRLLVDICKSKFTMYESVPADVKGVVELVSDYKDWLSSNNKSEDRKIVEEIEETLQKWLARQDIDRQVDIELVLEAIERLENANNDLLLDFLDNKRFKLSQFKGEDTSFSKGLKQCIREKCFIPEDKTRYLKPLLDFLNLDNTLSIFSTNYDNSIEQFCSSQEVRCEVGFDTVGWNPELFKELKKGIKLYKIHGSITWWKTGEEDYNNLPLKDLSEMIELSSGRAAIPAIVFPGKKLEYSEPVFDTLAEFKRQLRVAGYVFIVGYSFKDEHITRLFQYAAKKNRKLIVILVTPSAYNIYNKIRYHKSEFNTSKPSKLEGRVICLPYRIEKVLPILKHRYLDNLIEAEQLETESARLPEKPNWKERMASRS